MNDEDRHIISSMITTELFEHDKTKSTLGCPSPLTCMKTKELEEYIKGPVSSKMNDLKIFQDAQIQNNIRQSSLNEVLISYYHDACNDTRISRTSAMNSEKLSEEIIKESKKVKEGFEKNWNKIIITIICGIFIYLLQQAFMVGPKNDKMIAALKETYKQNEFNQVQMMKGLLMIGDKLDRLIGDK